MDKVLEFLKKVRDAAKSGKPSLHTQEVHQEATLAIEAYERQQARRTTSTTTGAMASSTGPALATEKQVNYLRSLLEKNEVEPEDVLNDLLNGANQQETRDYEAAMAALEEPGADISGLTKFVASRMIDRLVNGGGARRPSGGGGSRRDGYGPSSGGAPRGGGDARFDDDIPF